MKKYSWIVALLLALSLAFAFVSCGDGGGNKDPEEEVDLVEKVVFELATDENIQKLALGKITFGKGEADPQPIKPLMRAGDDDDAVVVTAVKGPGDQAVSLEVEGKTSWGAGLDLLSAAPGNFAFREGDVITVKGEALAVGTKIQLNAHINSEHTIASVTAVGPIDWEVTLTAENITHIKQGVGGSKGGPWPGIRFAANEKGKFRVDNIKIVGLRASNLVTLAAPVVSVTETGVEWAAVEGAMGYEVYIGAAAEPFATLTADKTNINLKSDRSLDPGDYSVTVVAIGSPGESKDSAKSTAVTYTKPEPEVMAAVIVIDSDADFNYVTGDGPGHDTLPVSLKGNIEAAISEEILSYTTGEVWIYWVSAAGTDIAAGYGIGQFGGVNYNSGEGGTEGIAVIPISELSVEKLEDGGKQPNYVPTGQLHLNPYNGAAVVKIEVYQ